MQSHDGITGTYRFIRLPRWRTALMAVLVGLKTVETTRLLVRTCDVLSVISKTLFSMAPFWKESTRPLKLRKSFDQVCCHTYSMPKPEPVNRVKLINLPSGGLSGGEIIQQRSKTFNKRPNRRQKSSLMKKVALGENRTANALPLNASNVS